VFDKAQWHIGGDFPSDTEPYQAYVHTGFYVGWLILNDLVSQDFKDDNIESINSFKSRELTAVALYAEQMDGVFTSDDVNDIGYAFTKAYFDFDTGQYLTDYATTLAADLSSIFEVEDSWQNFDMISKLINLSYQEYREGH
jgi:hypothetical protein